MEEKEILLTQEGYDNLEKELDYLKTEERAAIAERIRVALGFGDLSENSGGIPPQTGTSIIQKSPLPARFWAGRGLF